MAKDSLVESLKRILKDYAKRAGTDLAGAIRDVMTELCHLCDEHDLDFDERFADAKEVYKDEQAEILIDQYGEPVPDDLVVLPQIALLDDAEIDIVDRADWYEVKGMLLASAKQIKNLSETDPTDCGVSLKTAKILYVASSLHRWSREDGFYHA